MSDSDRRFHAIVQQAGVGIVVGDREGRMLEANGAFHRMLGYPEPELRGKRVSDVTHPDDRDVGLELYRELATGKRDAYEIEKRYLRRDGSAFWARVRATAMDTPGSPDGLVIAVVQDVDAGRRAEEALREAEQRYRTLVEGLPLVTYIDALDDRSSNIYTSPQLEPILGYTTDEWVADPDLFVKLLHPDDRDRVLAEIAATNASGERFTSEYRLIGRDGRTVWFRDESVVVRDPDGTPLYSQGYLLDISEHKASEEALRESEQRFRRLADDGPVLVRTAGPDGRVTFLSQTWLELVGRTFEDLVGTGWVESVHPDDAPAAVAAYEEAVRNRAPWEAEYRVRRPDGSLRWIADRGKPQLSPQREILGYVCVGIDVTERRETEEALRRREAVLEAVGVMAERLLQAPTLGDVDFLQPLAEALGAGRACVYLTREETDGTTAQDLVAEWTSPGIESLERTGLLRRIPTDASPFGRSLELLARGHVLNAPVSEFPEPERELIRSAGIRSVLCAPVVVGDRLSGVVAFHDVERERRWRDAEVDAVRAAAGILGGALQRDEAVRSLRETSDTLSALVDASPAAIYGCDRAGNIVLWNRAAERMFGWSAEEAIGAFTPFVSEEMKPEYFAYLERALRGESWSNVELRRVRRDGSPIDLSASSSPLRNADGEITGLASVIVDITEEKRIRDALRESESRFAAFMENAQAVAFMKDEEGRYVYANQLLERTFGLAPGEVIGKTDFEIFTEEAAREFARTDELVRASGEPVERLEQGVDGQGRPVWFLALKFPFEDGQGNRYVGGVSLDVTERERAQLELVETTRTLESLVANAPLAIITSDRDGNVTGWNPAAERMLGWTAEETIGGGPPHFVPGDSDGFESRARAAAGHVVSDAEARRLRKDGTVIDVRYGKAPLLDARGEVVGTMAMLTDVTERKRAEAELLETTKTLEATVESSPVAIMTFDREGRVTRWNGAAERTFGWAAEEVIGRFNPILMEDGEQEFSRAIQLTLEGRSWRNVEGRRRHKDGSIVDVSISAAPLHDAEGVAIGMVAVLVDISERKRAEARFAAQHAVARVLASSVSLDDAAPAILDAVCEGLAWDVGILWVVDRERDRLVPVSLRAQDEALEPFVRASLESAYSRGIGLPGRVWEANEPIWLAETPSGPAWPRREQVESAGIGCTVAAPVEAGGELVGVLEFSARLRREPEDDLLAMLTSVGRQLGQFLRRVEADAAVREREERFRTLVANLPGAVYRCAIDEERTVEYLSDPIVDICGFPASDFIGNSVRAFSSIVHPSDLRKVERIVDEAIASGTAFEVEYRVLHADGTIRWVSEKGQPIAGPGNGTTYLDGVIFDVTESKRAQDEVARANALLDSVVESLPTPLFLKDAESLRFVRVNRAVEELWGIERSELLGRNDLDFFPPEQAALFMAIDREVLASREVLDIAEEPIDTRTQGRRYLHTRKVPIAGEDGQPQYVLGLSVDITEAKHASMERDRLLAAEQKALEQAEAARAQLAEQNESLLELDRLKDEFVALVSHELRTPLTSILGYLELLVEGDAGPITPEQAHFLGIVERNSQRLLRLVGDLLFVAQIEAGKLTIERDAVDLARLVEECLEAARPRATEKGIELCLERGPVQPVLGDRVRLAQLLDNLVSNAIKFTPEGGRVRVGLEGRAERVTLAVADTGIGIPEAERDQLFQRFFRTSSAVTGAIQGTGLGLTITKAIAEAHGGSISVESEEGRGTTFVVHLPLPGDPGRSTGSPWEPMKARGKVAR